MKNIPIKARVALDNEELLHEDSNLKYKTQFQGHIVYKISSILLTENDADLAIE